MNVLSLFAGIGGIDLGLEAHGCKTVAYSEVDPFCLTVLARQFPDADSLGDVEHIDWSQVRDDYQIDIIAGGFPCQDISLAGSGGGIDGSRSGLWRYYADAIRCIRPRGILVENVAALASRGLDRVLGDLAACGYDAEWDCIPAGAVGAAHLRDRMFIVAYPSRASSGSGPGGDEAASAYTDSDGRIEAVHGNPVSTDGVSGAHSSGRQAGCEDGWPIPPASSQWESEPAVGRLAHGIPGRVDRIRALGNAVVPQVAEHVGSILMERIRSV